MRPFAGETTFERTLNLLSEIIALPAAPVRTSPSNLDGERAQLSDCLGAWTTYRRDLLGELSSPRSLAQAVRRTCARWSSDFHRHPLSATLAEPVRGALDSVSPCSSHGWRGRARRTFLNGETGGARAGMPTHMPAHARVHVRCQARSALHLCGCYARAGCDSDAPRGDITSAVARAVATALPHVCVPIFPWSCVGPAKRAL
jgi:hypothetical protein